MGISYELLRRQLERAQESLTHPELPAGLGSLYEARLKGPAAAFTAAQAGLVAAEDAASKERREVKEALASLVQPYRYVRALVAGHLPDVGLPDTLAVLPTDTDKKLAIEALLLRIESNAGQAWADELAKSEFATRAPQVVKEIVDDIASRSALSSAVAARAAAYGPASDGLVAYRAAVRAGAGSASPIYKRLIAHDRPAATAAAPVPAPTA